MAGGLHETESIAAELERLGELRPVFDAVGAIGERVAGVFLVGGTVRDILLGEPSFDVDIAVEGDGIAFARALAAALNGRARVHAKFGTAVVLYGEGRRVDVVTARREVYAAPAALPTVEHAALRDDLFRRDFTINAMAASLQPGDFGCLVDPFRGRGDLASRTVRVLHDGSFVDDPTRVFRAVRYENRYGLRMEDHTASLARACVERGLLGDLSPARLRDELVALLDEAEVGHSLERLAELGAARAVHPQLAADEETADLRDRLVALDEELALDVPRWRLGLIALARHMSRDVALDWLRGLALQRGDADAIAEAVAVGPRLASRAGAEGLAPADIVALVEPHRAETALYALALSGVPAIRRYFTELRGVRLEIRGGDLAELGVPESPRVGEILSELRRRKLNGELDGRASELAAARELIGR
jgi:tRNA nucleotidyltransferase (CCA-adding enzyme)